MSTTWPKPENADLLGVVAAFRARSKTIHYHGSIESDNGIDDGREWLNVFFTPCIPDWPSVELTLWEDFFADVTVRSRKRKSRDKRLLWLEAVYLQRKPSEIVEAFVATVRAGTQLHETLRLWTALEKSHEST